MGKKARQPRPRPKPIAMERPKKNWKSNNENTIALPDNLNQNRSTKALFGFAMIALGVLAIVTPGERGDSCVFFLISSCIGLSLIIQSIPKKRPSLWAVISYTIISIFIVIFGLTFLVIGAISISDDWMF